MGAVSNGGEPEKLTESKEGRGKLLRQSEQLHDYVMNDPGLQADEKLRLLQLTLQVIPALIRDEELRKEMTTIVYPQTLELEMDRYGNACKAEGIIGMGRAANMESSKIISILSELCDLTPNVAQEAYDRFIAGLPVLVEPQE